MYGGEYLLVINFYEKLIVRKVSDSLSTQRLNVECRSGINRNDVNMTSRVDVRLHEMTDIIIEYNFIF